MSFALDFKAPPPPGPLKFVKKKNKNHLENGSLQCFSIFQLETRETRVSTRILQCCSIVLSRDSIFQATSSTLVSPRDAGGDGRHGKTIQVQDEGETLTCRDCSGYGNPRVREFAFSVGESRNFTRRKATKTGQVAVKIAMQTRKGEIVAR